MGDGVMRIESLVNVNARGRILGIHVLSPVYKDTVVAELKAAIATTGPETTVEELWLTTECPLTLCAMLLAARTAATKATPNIVNEALVGDPAVSAMMYEASYCAFAEGNIVEETIKAGLTIFTKHGLSRLLMISKDVLARAKEARLGYAQAVPNTQQQGFWLAVRAAKNSQRIKIYRSIKNRDTIPKDAWYLYKAVMSILNRYPPCTGIRVDVIQEVLHYTALAAASCHQSYPKFKKALVQEKRQQCALIRKYFPIWPGSGIDFSTVPL